MIVQKKDDPNQGKINCGASSELEIIQNNFLTTRMIEFLDIRDKCRKSGLESQEMWEMTSAARV